MLKWIMIYRTILSKNYDTGKDNFYYNQNELPSCGAEQIWGSFNYPVSPGYVLHTEARGPFY